MSDAIFRIVVWLDSAPWGLLALIWLALSVAFGGIWAFIGRRDQERVKGINGEWY